MKKSVTLEVSKFAKKIDGISLIVLIITILVITVLAGAVILTVSQNNPLERANEALFKSDVISMKEELMLYVLANNIEKLDSDGKVLLNADKISVTENEKPTDNNRNIINVISVMTGNEYSNKFEVINGELVYIGTDPKESEWCNDLGIEIKEMKIILTLIPDETSISGKIVLSGLFANVDKLEKYEIYISKNNNNFESPVEVSTEKRLEKNILIENLTQETEYYIKVDVTIAGVKYSKVSDKVITKIDTIAPNATIKVLDYVTSIKAIINFTDNDGGSGININDCKYVIDTSSEIYEEDNAIWEGSKKFDVTQIINNIANITEPILPDGEYYIHVLSVDNKNNKKSVVSDKILIDNTAPDVNSLTVTLSSGTNWTKVDPTVTINGFPSDAVIKQYRRPGSSTWENYIAPFTVSQNGTINVRTEDTAGNESTKTFTVDKIDKIEPSSVAFNPNSVTNVKNVTVQVTGQDKESGVQEVKIVWTDNGTIIDKGNSVWNTASSISNGGTVNQSSITGTKYLQTKIKDKAGNEKVFVSGAYTIDNTAPNVNNLTVTLSSGTNWTKVDPTVTINGFPSDAVIKQYRRPGSSTWENYIAPFTVSQNGTINVRTEDTAGNESTKTFTVDKIDKIVPVVTNFTYTVTHNSITVTSITASDAGGSGIALYRHHVPGIWWNEPGITSQVATISGLQANTAYGVEVRARDGAGNDGYKTINVTTAAPPIVKENVAVINRTYDGLPPNYLNPIIPRGFKPIDVDNNGNKTAEKSITKLKPKNPNFIETELSFNTIKVRVNATGQDNLEVAGYMYSLDNTNWSGTEGDTKLFSGLAANTNYTVYVKAVARDGMIGEVSSKVYKTVALGYVPNNRTYDNGAAGYANPMIPRGFKPIIIQ